MADQDFDFSAAEGLLKVVADKLGDARPNHMLRFTNWCGYDSEKTLGELLRGGQWLTEEFGITHDAGSGVAFDLVDSIAAQSRKMEGSGAEIVLRTTVAMKALKATQKEGDAAFKSAYGELMRNMRRSGDRRLEVVAMWGQHPDGIALIGDQTVDAGVNQTFSVKAGHWAPGIWAGAEGMRVDVWDPTFTTRRNLNGTMKLVSVTHEKGPSVLGTLKFLGTEAEMDTIAPDDVITFEGAYDDSGDPQEMVGMMVSSQNDSEYAADFSQWGGNTFAVGANLTWEAIDRDIIGLAVDKGLDTNIIGYVSTRSWSNLNVDLHALRVLDSSFSQEKTTAGTKSISWQSSVGVATMEPYAFMKSGSCLFFPDDKKRITRNGSTDWDFKIPEAGGKYMRVLEGKHGVEFRSYTDQLVVNRAVPHCVTGTGIVNS